MDEDEKKALFWVKFIHFFNFCLFSLIYGAFAFAFWRILKVDRPECIAPKEEYLANFKEQNIDSDDIKGIDVTWQFNFALKWGLYTNLIFSFLWLLAGLTLLPVKVTNPSGLFFFGTQIWCGCLAILSPVPAAILIIIPVFIWSHAGKFCSGVLLEETNN